MKFVFLAVWLAFALAAQTPDNPAPPAADQAFSAAKEIKDPAQRAEVLTRQLDATLTDRLARIRQQVSETGNTASGGQAAPLRLDIRA